jgi:hypothetical protein
MNINDNQTSISEKQCCADFCSTTFITPEEVIINNYKCSRKEFSTADAWNIQKQRRQFAIGSNIIVTGR